MDKAVIIYVDFDNTLYVHEVQWSHEEDFDYNMFFGFGKIKYSAEYLNHELINKLKTISEYYANQGIKCIINLLTGCKTSIYFKSKTDFLDEAEPSLFNNYFSVSAQEEKLSMISAFNCEMRQKYEIADVLVIDDDYRVTSACQSEGITAVTPGFFEKHYNQDMR
jgi:hypothetical protein